MSRDTSRDGIGNRLQTYALTHFPRAWTLVQHAKPLARVANKALIDRAIGMISTRPFEDSLMTLDPCVPDTQIPKKTDSYSSWDSLNDRRYTGRHLPPDPEFNREGKLPKLGDPQAQRELKRLYGQVDNIEFYVGLYAEPVGWDIVRNPITLADVVRRNTPSNGKAYNVSSYRT